MEISSPFLLIALGLLLTVLVVGLGFLLYYIIRIMRIIVMLLEKFREGEEKVINNVVAFSDGIKSKPGLNLFAEIVARIFNKRRSSK
jgi:hypothetical protein